MTAKRALVGALVAVFVCGTVWAYATGRVSSGSIKAWLDSLGPLAPALFVVAFVLGAFIGMPGMVFVIGGRLAFGPETGFVLGYGGGMLACLAPFATARFLRGERAATWQPRGRLLRRAFAMIESHPLRAVLLLRLALWFNPPLSYALAMTRVPVRTYLAGCAVALAPVVAVAMLATGWIA
ncbi:MAG TPA: VTT domain-containing protein [Kofleriaceae bacterium]|nr:VTT domain-containing protein [Kofleriaceae bacterium]